MPKKPDQLIAQCSHCHSFDVLADAYAEWSLPKQQWVVASTFDKGAYCNKCQGETRIEFIPVRKAKVAA